MSRAIINPNAVFVEHDDDEHPVATGLEEPVHNPEAVYAKEDLPPYHCRYCFQHDPKAMARCVKCDLWFCNGTGGNLHTSHMMYHLKTVKHDEVATHIDGPLGDSKLECFCCGSRNVFVLGYVLTPDEQAVLLCREKCCAKETHDSITWSANDWQPLILEGKFVPWLITVPTEAEQSRCRKVSRVQMRSLERLWKTNRAADIEDITETETNGDRLIPLPKTFVDGEDYVDAMTTVLREELRVEKQLAAEFEVKVEINFSTGHQCVALIPRGKHKLHIGARVTFRNSADADGTAATVLSIRRDQARRGDEVLFSYMRKSDRTPTNGVYSMGTDFNSVNYQRMYNAMTTMLRDQHSLSNAVFHAVVGRPRVGEKLRNVRVPNDLRVAGLPALNESQDRAVRHALEYPVGLIQGPPGTGKTTTCAALIYHMCTINDAQVLVTASANAGVDHLACRVALTGLRVVRLFAKSREEVDSEATSLGLHTEVRRRCQEARRLLQLKDDVGYLSNEDYRELQKVTRATEHEILAEADVICTTCIGAGDMRLAPFRFKHVVIDEATQAIEPESLIPMTCGAKQVILVGDHCQLGPVINCKAAEHAGLGRSLFERQVLLGVHSPIRLDVQYRMHPAISRFSAKNFYEDQLFDGVTAADRAPNGEFPWPNRNMPTLFVHVDATAEEVGSTGASFLNRGEAERVVGIISHLLSRGVLAKDIGVVSPYNAQRDHIYDLFATRRINTDDLEISSVESFQGREKNFIVLTCVRASEEQGIGFLGSWQRANVALTRAKRGLFIVGNAMQLARNKLWHAIAEHYLHQQLLVTGTDTTSLQIATPLTMQLPEPKNANEQMGPPQVRGRR